MYWQEKKKRTKQVPLSFFPDMECMELDFYHCFACYFLVGAASCVVPGSQGWIFPHLHSNPAAKVTDIVKKLSHVPGVPDGATGTCLRVGAAVEVTKRADVVAAVHRGGWYYPNASLTTMMEYNVQTGDTIALVGKALHGWADPNLRVYPPRCDPILSSMTP